MRSPFIHQAKQDLQARISAQLLSILLPVMRRLSQYLRDNRIRRGLQTAGDDRSCLALHLNDRPPSGLSSLSSFIEASWGGEAVYCEGDGDSWLSGRLVYPLRDEKREHAPSLECIERVKVYSGMILDRKDIPQR